MRVWILAFALLALPAGIRAQAPAATVTVTAQGSFRTAPDTAVVQMEIRGQNAALKAAYAQAQSQAEAVRVLLRQQGFKPEQAHWSGFSVQPNFDYKTQRITSYTVSNDLELDVSDFTHIGDLLDAATGRGLAALRTVTFRLSHPAAAKAAAIADGYHKAHAEALALAQAADEHLAGLQAATVDTSRSSPSPLPRVMAMSIEGASAPPPTAEFTPQPITVTASITAIYRLRP